MQFTPDLCGGVVWGITAGALVCRNSSKGRWRHRNIQALMRVSWCGHFAVIGVLASGVLNAWPIAVSPHAYDSLGPNSYCSKTILVMIMVVIALANRYVVPRMRQDEDRAAPWFNLDD